MPEMNSPGRALKWISVGGFQQADAELAFKTACKVEKQKKEFAAILEARLREGTACLAKQRKDQAEASRKDSEDQKTQRIDGVNQKLHMTEMAIEQQYRQQLMALNQAAMRQNARLEQQAMQPQPNRQAANRRPFKIVIIRITKR